MTEISTFFESRYSVAERYWWNVPWAYSTDPDDLATSLLGRATLRFALGRPVGRAIDVGSGEGADAVRLARLGWVVEAVELTEAGCRKISVAAEALGVSVRVHRADIRDFEPDGDFDIVICNGVLHYLEEKTFVCSKLQGMTAHGGANVVSVWSDFTAVPDCHKIVPTYPDQERGAVYQSYAHWEKELLYFERSRPEAGHDEMEPHVHSHLKMLAVRKE